MPKKTRGKRKQSGKTPAASDRESATGARLASNENLRGVVEAAPFGMAVTRLSDGVILCANSPVEALLGIPARDLVGRTSPEFFSEPAVHEKFVAELRAVGRLTDYEVRLTRPDGTEVWVVTSAESVDFEGESAIISAYHEITERKQAEEALRESEDRFRDLIENANDVVYTLDLTGRFTSMNDAGLRILGYTLDEVLQMNPSQIVPQEYHRHSADAVRRRFAGQAPVAYELEIITKRGRRVPFEVNPRLIYEGGRPIAIQAIARDITERKRAEDALRESERKFRALADATPAAITIFNEEGGLYANPATESITGYSAEEMKGMFLVDLVHPDLRDFARRMNAARMRGEEAPPRYELKIVTKRGEERWMDVSARPIEFEGKPATLGTAFDITDRKRAEEALSESEQRLRFITEATPAAIMITGASDGAILYANDAAERVFGAPPQGLRGRSALELWGEEEDRSAVLEELREKGAVNGRTLLSRKVDGTLFSSEVWLRPIIYGGVAATIGTIQDVTERTLAERALRESEARFRVLAEATPAAITIFKEEGVLYANPATEAMTGYSAEELKGVSLVDLVHPDLRDFVRRTNAARMRGEEAPPRFEAKIVTKRGEERWLDISDHPIEFDGELATLGTAFDITDNKRMEEALSESEQKFRALAEATPAAILIFNEAGMIYGNPAIEEISGYSVEEIAAMGFDRLIHPDFREVAAERREGRLHGADVPTRYEVEIVTKQGEERWLDISARRIEFEGKPATLGTAFDITDRKRAEDQLHDAHDELEHRVQERTTQLTDAVASLKKEIGERELAEAALGESEERYRTLVETMNDGLGVQDANGVITYVNQRFCQMVGYSSDELVGRRVTDLLDEKNRRILTRQMAGRRRGTKDRYDLTFTAKDGGKVTTLMAPQPVIDAEGNFEGSFAVMTDITDQKRMEETLERVREELETKVEHQAERGNPYGLTFRELTVLNLVAQGKSDREVAEILGIRHLTARKHIANLLSKMGAGTRTEAGVRAVREGIID
jgi:PAS domain S-box-containing protein